MAEYGKCIGDGIDLSSMEVYNFFTNYFHNPKMKKVKTLPDGHLMYACRIKSMLTKDKKYVFLIVNSDMEPESDVVKMADIRWEVLQTRMIETLYDAPLHDYNVPNVEIPIKVFEKDDEIYKYSCTDYKNIIVSLLIGKNQTRMYGDYGDLGTAIETYNTIVSLE